MACARVAPSGTRLGRQWPPRTGGSGATRRGDGSVAYTNRMSCTALNYYENRRMKPLLSLRIWYDVTFKSWARLWRRPGTPHPPVAGSSAFHVRSSSPRLWACSLSEPLTFLLPHLLQTLSHLTCLAPWTSSCPLSLRRPPPPRHPPEPDTRRPLFPPPPHTETCALTLAPDCLTSPRACLPLRDPERCSLRVPSWRGREMLALSVERCVLGAPLSYRKHPRPFATAARWWPPRPEYPFEEGIELIAQGVGWVDPEAGAFVRLMAGSRLLPPLADPPPRFIWPPTTRRLLC